MLRHSCAIFRELVVSTLLGYTSMSNAVVGNTILKFKIISHRISVDFDAEVFWRQLLGFTYFVKTNGCISFQ